MSQINLLNPPILWGFFSEILEIPRPSKKEEKIRSFLIKFAKTRKLKYKTDSTGNLLISKPASIGYENKKTVILQSHMDMVCEKNLETIHNFDVDPILPRIEGNWVKATGTTLGADDGIGIAAQMAILASDNLEHGPIECLFTVDEETGLTGANALEPDFFKGSILLNLDSEDEGELFIGCSGGIDTLAEIKFKTRIFPNRNIAFEVSITGLNGGHSGDEIHKNPTGNSNKILNRFLWNSTELFNIRLSNFNGGNLRNAIPREAKAIFAVSDIKKEALLKYFEEFKQSLKNEIQYSEPNFNITIKETEAPETVLNKKSQERLLNTLYACPHGVIKWSDTLENMVETSTNLASVKFNDNKVMVTTSQRSSIDSSKIDIANRISAVFKLAKAKVWHSDGYPGWNPNKNSEIVNITEQTYQDLFHTKPVVRAIHAGLECGLFLQKYPHLDMISFGPTIKGAHSPDERIEIESAQKFWDLLLEVLKRIPDQN